MQKKRRNVRRFGCMREINRSCDDWKLWGLETEEICWRIAVIVASYVSVKIVVFLGKKLLRDCGKKEKENWM